MSRVAVVVSETLGVAGPEVLLALVSFGASSVSLSGEGRLRLMVYDEKGRIYGGEGWREGVCVHVHANVPSLLTKYDATGPAPTAT